MKLFLARVVLLGFLYIRLLVGGWANASEFDCAPVEGVDQALTAKIVVFGEYHGTVEIPELFGDAVCIAVERYPNEKLLVALELPNVFNRYFQLTREGDAALALEQAKRDAFWNEMADGRHSSSMLSLVLRLMSMAQSRPDHIQLIAVERQKIDSEGALFLAENIRTSLPDRTIVLIGNAHAMKRRLSEKAGTSFVQNLAESKKSIISLTIIAKSGSAWVCLSKCEARQVLPTDLGTKRKVIVGYESENGVFDGVFYLPHLSVSPELGEGKTRDAR
jgi:hypothetical protein